ncbi:MAG: TolC family protein, partial [Ferrovum sp.]|nr:TolC family protein [Ferrovum sp.]
RLAWNDWEIAQDQVKTAGVGLSLAEQLMAQTKDQFQNGVADGLALVLAETNLASARATEINAQASLAWAWVNFQMATGQITFNS